MGLGEGLILPHNSSVDGVPKDEIPKDKVDVMLVRSAPGLIEFEPFHGKKERRVGCAERRAGWLVAVRYSVEMVACLCLAIFPAIVLYHETKDGTSLIGEHWEGADGSSWSKVSVIDMIGSFLSAANWVLCSTTAAMTLSNFQLPVLRAVADGVLPRQLPPLHRRGRGEQADLHTALLAVPGEPGGDHRHAITGG